jgi:hypothetical protein
MAGMPLRRTMRLAWSTHRGERKVSGKMVKYAYLRREQFPCQETSRQRRLYEVENIPDSGTNPKPWAQRELPVVSVFFTLCKDPLLPKLVGRSNHQTF